MEQKKSEAAFGGGVIVAIVVCVLLGWLWATANLTFVPVLICLVLAFLAGILIGD
jgi:hypothetical protein